MLPFGAQPADVRVCDDQNTLHILWQLVYSKKTTTTLVQSSFTLKKIKKRQGRWRKPELQHAS
jgi:hypothetical protein